MINLIPPAARRGVLVEYWIRVVSVWCILISISLFTTASLLLPAYVFVNSQVKVHQQSAEIALQKVADYDAVSVSLIQASQRARKIMDEENLFQISEYVDLFEQLQSDDILVSNIKIGRVKEGVSSIVVGGIANNRQTLASFRDRLLADTRIEKVDLPISNLARDKDISFTITVTLSNQKNSL